jgi:WD40 repeat protein
MIPAHRLETLLDLAMQKQVDDCMYHNCNDENGKDLFEDHKCSRMLIPHQCTNVLEAHTDEVWYVVYSPDGLYLSSASKDGSVVVWNAVSDSLLPITCTYVVLTGFGRFFSFFFWLILFAFLNQKVYSQIF